MVPKVIFVAVAIFAIVSPSFGQLFGGRQNLSLGAFNQQVGYRAGPAWGSISQSVDRQGFRGPVNLGAGVDYASKQGHGFNGNVNFVPGEGGQGSLRGDVGILNKGNHHLSGFVQHDRPLDKNFRSIGPETNSAGLNYAHSKGISAFLTGSQTRGNPIQTTVGGSVPVFHKKNFDLSVSGQSTFGHGMKPQHQANVGATFNF